jgi:hypothetical protein
VIVIKCIKKEMKKMKISLKKKFIIKIKNEISKIVLFFLYKGFKVTYKHDDNVKKEIDSWKNGFSAVIDTGVKNTKLIIKKENNKIVKLKKIENPDIEIKFKSLEAAFLIFTGRLGVSKAYAEHRFTLKGEIGKAMSLVRCIDIVEAYLFPNIITKNILKYKPQKSMGIIRTYVFALLNI